MDFDTRYEQWTLLVIGIKKKPILRSTCKALPLELHLYL